MKEAEQDAGEFGAALRRAREARQLSIEAVTRACMLSDQQIIGLESADYQAFYSCEYARRAAQRYAEFLQVPTVPLIENIGGEVHAGFQQRSAISLIKIRRRTRVATWSILLLSVISACVLAAAFFVWDRYGLALQLRSSNAFVWARACQFG